MGCLRTRGYAKESRLSFRYGFGVAGSQSPHPIRFEQWRPATKASKAFSPKLMSSKLTSTFAVCLRAGTRIPHLGTLQRAKGIDVGKLIHDQNWLIRSQGKFYTYDAWLHTAQKPKTVNPDYVHFTLASCD